MFTPPLRVFLVDDEELALKRLARMLREHGGVEILGQETEAENAVKRLSVMDLPDALLLDIQMPGLNGFELLLRLPAPPPVVFTTAYDQYALQAFEVNSLDYLLKPITAVALARALNKVARFRGTPAPAHWPEMLAQMARNFKTPSPDYPLRIASRVGERIRFVELSRVTHFFAADKLTYAATYEKNHIVDKTLAELEKTLDPRQFVRVHRSALVNLAFVDELQTWFTGQMRVCLRDPRKTELSVARDRVRELKERLGL